MKLMEKILSQENLEMAIRKVKQNKGAPGIDRMTVQEIEYWFEKYQDELITKIMNKQYRPMPVKRVYIPKPNGKQRPLGIPTVIDRVIQQAIAQVLSTIYEPIFSEHSFGFRPRRSAHMAMEEVLYYLNEGYEWIVDLDIEKFFDTVNHDKLISILREHVNDAATLHLIRAYLRAGVLEDGLIRSTTVGTPQGGPISVVLSNIYLDKFDKELESRGLRFVRYADDCIIFVKSEMSANRVMKSVISWLERKLFLKVSATKTKVIRPVKGQFLGFTFYKDRQVWKCRPTYATSPFLKGVFLCLKSTVLIVLVLMFTRTLLLPPLVSLTRKLVSLNIFKKISLLLTMISITLKTGLLSTNALMSAWNLPVNIGSLCSTSLRLKPK